MDCECKKTDRAEEDKKRLIVRLNKIEGQIRALKRMVENDSYCIDILVQSSAASGALSAFEKELLSAHISGCVVNEIKNGDESVAAELNEIIGRLLK